MGVYTIPAGVSFAHALASVLLDEYADDCAALSRVQVFLPTSRAKRALIDAFLDLSDRQALLLPDVQVIGQYEEDDLSLFIAASGAVNIVNDIPPVIDPVLRQGLLSQLIMKVPGRSETPAQAMQLAAALARLMDQIYTEGLSFDALYDLVPDDFAEHWQITLEFLKILSEQWPSILDDMGVIDAANRRDILIRKLTEFWSKHPHDKRVIAAGSTGSIPATAEFLKCVSRLPNGDVVLPGFDGDLSDADWMNLPLHHPQGGFKKLLSRFEILPCDVQLWPYASDVYFVNGAATDRRNLLRQVMSPDHGGEGWSRTVSNLQNRISYSKALENVSLCEVEHEEDEAKLIALKLREFLEDNTGNAILITPDRNLARRVIALSRRWGIDLDDSGGEPLSKSPDMVLLRLIAKWLAEPFDAISLLQVLKHELCMCAYIKNGRADFLWEIESQFFRSNEGLNLHALLMEENDFSELFDSVSGSVRLFWQSMRTLFCEFYEGSLVENKADLIDFLEGHKLFYSFFIEGSWLSCNDDGVVDEPPDNLGILTNDATEAIISFSILSDCFKDISIIDYRDLFDGITKSRSIRGNDSSHPRVRVLGQMEARISHADLVIMAGLNEGVWPDDGGVDPWMSRPMQVQLGLPDQDQYMSLSAHDFVQAFCQSEVMITRSTRMGGAFSVPSRWLQKLDILIDIADFDASQYRDVRTKSMLALLDCQDDELNLLRPKPSPPLASRPSKLSVTQLERLLQDPYGVYASHILRLRKINDLVCDNMHAIWGMIIHDVLEDFIRKNPVRLPDNSLDILFDNAFHLLTQKLGIGTPLVFEKIRIKKLFVSFLKFEQTWRENYRNLAVEKSGAFYMKLAASTFEISGRADRFDVGHDGKTIAVIDYKTGTAAPDKSFKKLLRPQIFIEAMMVRCGAFKDVRIDKIEYAGYWHLSGSDLKERKINDGDNLSDLLDDLEVKLHNLLSYFEQDDAIYYNAPAADFMPRYNDYLHLSRVQEWSKSNDGSSAEGD